MTNDQDIHDGRLLPHKKHPRIIQFRPITFGAHELRTNAMNLSNFQS